MPLVQRTQNLTKQMPWLQATGQHRNIAVAKAIILFGGAACIAAWIGDYFMLPGKAMQLMRYVGVGSIPLGIFVLVYLIRCPRCKAKPTLAFMKESSVGRWLYDLESATTCPSCGHHPALEREASAKMPTAG